MVDMSTNLGRPVASAQQVFEVIRPELRMAMAVRSGIHQAMCDGHYLLTPDRELESGADDHVESVVFDALLASALESVGSWSADEGLVYDRSRLNEFVRSTLSEAFSGLLDWEGIVE